MLRKTLASVAAALLLLPAVAFAEPRETPAGRRDGDAGYSIDVLVLPAPVPQVNANDYDGKDWEPAAQSQSDEGGRFFR
jgi:hypothetical protein